MDRKVENKLQEAYQHIKYYIGTEDAQELNEMCQFCEKYCGKEHDYFECENMPCFRNWLAMVYLKWETSYE